MRFLKTSLTVIGAITVLVLAGNSLALAATGHSLLLGKSNSADANTSITRTTSGSVLKLQSKSSANAPLTVNGKGKVTNLNADLVDGISASSLQTRTVRYALPSAASSATYNASLPGLAPGIYHVTYSAVASGTGVDCDFDYNHSSAYALLSYGVSDGGYTTINAAGVLDTRSDSVVFHCFGSGAFTMPTTEPSQLTFTRIDSLSSKSGTAARQVVPGHSAAVR